MKMSNWKRQRSIRVGLPPQGWDFYLSAEVPFRISRRTDLRRQEEPWAVGWEWGLPILLPETLGWRRGVVHGGRRHGSAWGQMASAGTIAGLEDSD